MRRFAIVTAILVSSVAFGAATQDSWTTSDSESLRPIGEDGRDILIYGDDRYMNFNLLEGSSGYGFRDNAGTMEVKSSGGAWSGVADALSYVPYTGAIQDLDMGEHGVIADYLAISSTIEGDSHFMGNVGVGTTSPSAKLEVNPDASGGILVNATGWPSVDLIADSAGDDYRTKITQSSVDGLLQFRVGQTATGVDGSSDSKMVIDNNGNIGIGTTSPGAKLDVVGGSAGTDTSLLRLRSNFTDIGTGATLKFQISSGSTTDIGSEISSIRRASNDGDLIFRTSNNAILGDRMVITGDGNIGIGTTAPDSKLHIKDASGTLKIEDTTGAAQLKLKDSTGSESTIKRDNSPAGLIFQSLTGNDDMVIDNTGNVGIGTTSPSQKLHVSGGNILLDNNQRLQAKDTVGTNRNLLYMDTANYPVVASEGNGYYLGNSEVQIFATTVGANSFITFDTSSSERVRIDNNGNVGIGTTSPNRKFEVAGSSSSAIVGVRATDDSSALFSINTDGSQKGYMGYDYNDNNIKLIAGDIFSNSANGIVITNNGNVGIGTTSPNSKLDVNGNTLLSGASRILQISDSGGATLKFANDNNAITYADNQFGFTTNQTQGFTFMGGNVGIGTDSPDSRLDIMGPNTGDQTALTITTPYNNQTMIQMGYETSNEALLSMYSGTAKKIQLSASGDSYFNGGNVGIGTTSPSAKLEVVNTTGGVDVNIASLKQSGSITSGDINSLVWKDGSNIIGGIGLKYTSASTMDYVFHSQYNTGYKTSSDVSMVIKGNGNVGIGTTEPGAKLEISDVGGATPFLKVAGTNAEAVRMTISNTEGEFELRTDSGSLTIDDNTDDAIRMTMDTSGNVGIGTASPTALLHLAAGTATNPQLKLADSTKLTTPETGSIEFYDGRFYITNVAHQRAIDRTNSALLETVTVENTTTETTVWTAEMDANSLMAGNIFKAHADGVISNGGPAAADQITIRIKVGGVTVATLEPITKTLTEVPWHLTASATQRTVGVSGERATHLDLAIGEEDATNVTGIATIDTTQDMDVTITAEWASADASNVFQLFQAYMSYKN